MESYFVRPAQRSDSEAIGWLWEELMNHHRLMDKRFTTEEGSRQRYVRHTQEMIRSRDSRVLVAETDSEIIGYLMGELQHRLPIALPGLYGFISDLYVRQEYRRRGIGRALYSGIYSWFIDKGIVAIELYAAECNPESFQFWRSMGLEPFLRLMHLDTRGQEIKK